MQVWLVTDPTSLSDTLFEQGIAHVDETSKAKIKRFYRRADSCRCLIGRLLPRVLLHERGFLPSSITFAATQAGKPYFTTPGIDPPIGFNVSHDNDLVAMAFAPGVHDPPAYRIGVDVMKVQLPLREPFRSFVDTVGDTLTSLEKALLLSVDVPEDEALRRFYLMWTMKEAYTKALGIGLGFDFRRIECDVTARTVSVDGAPPKGWEFTTFTLTLSGAPYQGVVARFVGGGVDAVVSEARDQVRRFEACSFVENAARQLKEK
ncbi:4'-phosphopantetheinyl transferase [Dentipellis sp. KUC8613]|nr:4'-phosphopantetheinyl transferase [Dentipellis sp. KUC8613]